jgi:hypothetical protein
LQGQEDDLPFPAQSVLDSNVLPFNMTNFRSP